ncbi:MAG: OsmC family peroxiredoxin [Bacteroidetes bacterium]|nr:MAG: OsmC family peroxiredoxin [Bacteroidota bacterium]
MGKEHRYKLNIIWTGNKGFGTESYRAYDRSHTISSPGKTDIAASADPAFLGDNTKYNPEEFLLAALSTCHMLWFLHLCADKGVIVDAYSDEPTGLMLEANTGGGQFKEVILNPKVVVADLSMLSILDELHDLAHKKCFIANSVNFPVSHIGNYSAREKK